MGGVVKSVVAPVKRIVGGGGGQSGGQSAAITQAPKKTDPEGKKIVARRSTRKRSRQVGRSLVGGVLPGGTNTVALGTVRNPRDSKTTLG